MLRSSAITAKVVETSCINLGLKLLSAFRVPPRLYTSILANTGGAMPQTPAQMDYIKVLLPPWSRLVDQGP
eukprot:7748576-Prorocentrum_lima.AAC.1